LNEFLAMKFTHLHPAEVLGRLLETAQSGIPLEEQYRRKDGTVFDLELSLRTITWSGKAAGLLLANDITERQTAPSTWKRNGETFWRPSPRTRRWKPTCSSS